MTETDSYSIKKTVRFYDIIIFLAFLFLIGTRIATLLYVSSVTEMTKATIEQVTTLVEANPFAKWFLTLNQVKAVLLSLVLPSFGIALYIYYRKKVLNMRFDVTSLAFYVWFTFYVLLLNVINDFSMLLGRMI